MKKGVKKGGGNVKNDEKWRTNWESSGKRVKKGEKGGKGEKCEKVKKVENR